MKTADPNRSLRREFGIRAMGGDNVLRPHDPPDDLQGQGGMTLSRSFAAGY
jgi:hypothetical protein